MIKKTVGRLFGKIGSVCLCLSDATDPPKPSYSLMRNDKEGFCAWVKGRRGNVFNLWQEYLSDTTGDYYCVGMDWVYCESVHEKDLKGTITSWDNHPKWFKDWVRCNGDGPHKTRYG